jgi:C4-dicarboxylate transporter DctM subunit
MHISPEIVGVLGIILMLALMLGKMWIGFALGIVGFLGLIYLDGFSQALAVLGMEPFRHLSDYIISVFPMFILMGTIASNTGIAEDLFRATNTWLGRLPGGLAMATCFAGAFFGAICGSSLAGTVTIGQVAVPEMKKYNYHDSLSTAAICAGGTLSSLIPPSLAFILYAVLTEQSVGLLFISGIGPGILLTLLYCAAIFLMSLMHPTWAPKGPLTTWKKKFISIKYVWAMAALFIFIMGGIYTGIFSPTEAGAIGAFGSIVITLIGRRLTFKIFSASVIGTAKTSGMIAAIIIGAFIFMRFMTVSALPNALAAFIAGMHVHRYIVFATIIVIYIIMGMFTDIIASVLITIPVIYPVILQLGFDPIWFGVMVVIFMEMGMITPPVGINVFVLGGLTNVPPGTIFRGVWWFVGSILICIALVTILPDIALWLPNHM